LNNQGIGPCGHDDSTSEVSFHFEEWSPKHRQGIPRRGNGANLGGLTWYESPFQWEYNATSALGNVVVEPGGMIDGKRPKLDVVRAMLSPIQSSMYHERAGHIHHSLYRPLSLRILMLSSHTTE
jgi:hypothetical protein